MGIYSGHNTFAGTEIQVFTDYDIERIHLASLDILWTIGVYVESDEALKRFEGAGAKVEWDNHIVKIPGWMVEESINASPSRITLPARDPQRDFVLEKDRVGVLPFYVGVNVKDPVTGKVRTGTKEDCGNLARLTDALDNYDIQGDPVIPQDVPAYSASLHLFDACLNNTTKSVWMDCTDARQSEYLIEMAAVVAGGKDKLKEHGVCFTGSAVVAPLTFSSHHTEIIEMNAAMHIPFLHNTLAMAGGTSPVTMAGTVAQANAEVLASITYGQLCTKGSPVIYSSSTALMDLQRGDCSVGAPEQAIFSIATTKLAQSYHIPSHCSGG